MGDTIWVEVQGRTALPADHAFLLLFQDALDRLSMQLGVARLSNFYDDSNYADEFMEEHDAGDGQAAESWFDPAQARAAVQALHDYLSQHPTALALEFHPDASQQHYQGALMEELQHCLEVLTEAVTQGRFFRFLIVA